MANIITITRLLCAVSILFTVPFSLLFWVLYIYCGVSDFADGLVARALNQQNDSGARLDSIADTVFFFVIAIAVIPYIIIPVWFWIFAIVIAIIRVSAYLISYKKHHSFSSTHTYANKVAGGLLFGSPVLYTVLGVTITGVILCIFTVFSACEELLIMILSEDLDCNYKSIFMR